jgi:hypothetical protein
VDHHSLLIFLNIEQAHVLWRSVVWQVFVEQSKAGFRLGNGLGLFSHQ